MWLPAVGLLLGLLLGAALSLSIPADYARYTAIAMLAAFDSVLGAVRAELEGQYDNETFISGFVSNAILAGLLTFVGDRLGVDLYLAAIVAFGVRLFNNLGMVRRYLMSRGKRRLVPRRVPDE